MRTGSCNVTKSLCHMHECLMSLFCVLSKEPLKRFAGKGKNKTLCEQDGRCEDIRFTKRPQNLGIRSGNTTDSL